MNIQSLITLGTIESQQVNATVAAQNCQIKVYQKTTGLYFDLTVGGVPVVSCVRVHHGQPLVLKAYSGFIGDFAFLDTQGISDPDWTGLGSRYVLVYLQ